ncbi:hypothetical protein DPMN_066577 [Dreissena polymorpha]|uniref:Uncharacterized protein n=1 Tax=Dreissena polymorpha TaxID=45954 RepID=A0A9D4BS58_DREPO|nr:hypothetical protein DPMN_066577 [Dreissena polymorpha]
MSEFPALKGTRLLRQGSADNLQRDFLPAPSSQLCLYGRSRRHRPSSRTPRRFHQSVERTEYRRPGSLL